MAVVGERGLVAMPPCPGRPGSPVRYGGTERPPQIPAPTPGAPPWPAAPFLQPGLWVSALLPPDTGAVLSHRVGGFLVWGQGVPWLVTQLLSPCAVNG